MSIYEAKGVTNGLLYLYDGESEKLSAEPFEFIKEFPALEVPEEMDILGYMVGTYEQPTIEITSIID